jgi:hypothetical protein
MPYKDDKKRRDYLKYYMNSDTGKLKSYKASAAKRGYEFTIKDEDFIKIIHMACVYCGIPEAMGADRKDNNLGYVLENCVPCCKFCNHMKSDYSLEMFSDHIARIYKHLN